MGLLRIAIRGLLAALMFAEGLVCAVAALVAQAGRIAPRPDMLAHFAPFWLIGAAVVVAYGLLLAPGAMRTIFLTVGGVGMVAAGALILPELTRPMSPRAPADAPHQIKLIQFNVWASNLDIDGTAQWIADQDADIVILEEARPVIRDAVLKRHPYNVVCKNCSVVIFSKTKATETDVPSEVQHGPRPSMARATFRDEAGDYTVLGLHYTWPTADGMQQAQGRMVSDVLNRLPKDRMILTGDFNSTPWSFSRRREDAMFGLERRTKALFSWPAYLGAKVPFPFLPIDHVYAGKGWRTVSVKRGPRLGSDHYPVIVTLARVP